MTITAAPPDWQLEPDGPPRTTFAGRLALPVVVRMRGVEVAVIDLVLDGDRVADLYAALGAHLHGHGAGAGLRV